MVVGERLVAATAAKQKLRGVELHAAHGRVTGRDATRAPLSLPQPIVPSCRLQIGGETLTCECLLDQERSRRSRRGAGAAGEDKPQRSCEPEAHAAGEGDTSAEGAAASTPAACCSGRVPSTLGLNRNKKRSVLGFGENARGKTFSGLDLFV